MNHGNTEIVEYMLYLAKLCVVEQVAMDPKNRDKDFNLGNATDAIDFFELATDHLDTAIKEEVGRDALFLEKCKYHEAMTDKFNTTGKSPMELSSTPSGQKILDKINAKVAQAMTEKYGG